MLRLSSKKNQKEEREESEEREERESTAATSFKHANPWTTRDLARTAIQDIDDMPNQLVLSGFPDLLRFPALPERPKFSLIPPENQQGVSLATTQRSPNLPALPGFPKFSSLPTEIRIMIWKLGAPRHIKVTVDGGVSVVHDPSNQRLPFWRHPSKLMRTVMRTSYESRREIKRAHKLGSPKGCFNLGSSGGIKSPERIPVVPDFIPGDVFWLLNSIY